MGLPQKQSHSTCTIMVLESVISMSPTALHHTEWPRSISTLRHIPAPPPPTLEAAKYTAAMQEIHPLMLPCPPPFSTAMSAVDTTSSTTYKQNKPAVHRRDASDDELDVFEAASYYSGVADTGFRSGILPYGWSMKEARRTALGGGVRRSIDVPMMAPLPSQSHKSEKPTKEKETKQPISPGGRLASFLNSFFHQRSKKKSKSISAATSGTPQQYSCKLDHGDSESPGGRRKRRSSISHSRSTGGSSSEYSSSSSFFLYSSGSGAFRTAPPISLVFPRGKAKEEPTGTSQRSKYCSTGQAPPAGAGAADCPTTVHLPWERSRRASTNEILEKGTTGCSYYGAKSAVSGGGVAEKKWTTVLDNKGSRGMASRDVLLRTTTDGPLAKERSMWRREEDDEEKDGGESDSSSDLFELPNCDLQVQFASGALPVYETTSILESVQRGSSSSMASVAL